MEDVEECSISLYVWCPWCQQPCVDGRYPGEMTLMFVFFSLVPDGCLYWAFRKFWVTFSVYCAMPCEEIHVQYAFRVPADDGHYLPSREHSFCFFGFRRPWVKALY